jgi:apolipoprotein N-acyltransferase
MTFLLLMFPAAMATAWHLRGSRRRAWQVAAVGVGVVAAALVFGVVRLARSASGPTVKVGLIASDGPDAGRGRPSAALFEAYASRAAKLAGQGAQVIVVPEGIGVTVDPATRDTDARFQALAEQTQAVIVVGLIRVAAPLKYNEARVYTPGAPVQSYDKRHRLPPGELQFTPGHTLLTMPRPGGTWGVAICKDMDFTPLSRAYGRAGVALMLVPASDFTLDGQWHGHMALMRGVESGFAVVRAAKHGYLTVSDNRGRILAEKASGAAPFATLLAEVPATHDATLYLRLGDWFPWFALTVLAAAVVLLRRRIAR